MPATPTLFRVARLKQNINIQGFVSACQHLNQFGFADARNGWYDLLQKNKGKPGHQLYTHFIADQSIGPQAPALGLWSWGRSLSD